MIAVLTCVMFVVKLMKTAILQLQVVFVIQNHSIATVRLLGSVDNVIPVLHDVCNQRYICSCSYT